MAELPLLFFPPPDTTTRRRLGGGGASHSKPSAAQQRQRLDARFREIAASLHSFQDSAQGLEPEQVLVLETIGDTVEGLAKAAVQIPGLEWLAEMDLDDVEPFAGFQDEEAPDKPLTCRLYAVMTNQQAMDQLVGLWNDWCFDPSRRARRNFGPFKKLFENLRDVRRWNAEDRIHATGVLEYLNERLDDGDEQICFEVELWCRQSFEARNRAFEMLSSLVTAQGGQCIAQSAVPEIFYHGVLVKMPATAVQETVRGALQKNYAPLIRCEDVMFFRPFAQAGFVSEVEDSEAGTERPFDERPLPTGDPVIAILDGLPLEHHQALDGRLVIDDPEDIAHHYEPSAQYHGTAMASLVVHGDLNRNDEPLKTPVYHRPILIPKRDFDNRIREVVPDDELLVDVIHRTVRSLFEGDAAAPTVKLINLSVANSFQPFDRELSPAARLLDWLAWKYKVLFLVSVGNHANEIQLDVSRSEWQAFTPEDKCRATIETLHYDQVGRRPYSPSESINALTVGAMHADDSTLPSGDRRVDLLPGQRFPCTIGTVSFGHRRSMKPEIYVPGGRQFYHETLGDSDAKASFNIAQGFLPPGQNVAAPGQAPLELTRTVHTRGTSNATALASRLGGKIYERLLELQDEPGGDRLGEAELAVVLKCLLVHGASWADGAQLLASVFETDIDARFDAHRAWRELNRIYCRFLGYGEVFPEISQFSTDERVTMVGWSTIVRDQGQVFRVPLPPAMSGSRVRRRLTGTLAWLTPINSQHRNYRQASLWFHLDENQLGVQRAQVDSDTARRGTVEHRILEGEKVAAFGDGEDLEVTVNCKSDAGQLNASVPYALAVTLEVAEPLEVSIFDQVRSRIRPRIEIEPEG